ncbi:uncharacterized protein BO80DRAFT_39489 [Aspergillus ibericus CBS 121593]|uniref:Uncharacterized protein n=1 Tax=Aspergillus ibericus CBS 121593 TaxID=1448316 RepID=A0A395H2W7_9EURO|nr:hypothetical protein BO80DRAFT_39489 [Aspergillus ibericus CBS 121593]RAL02096.1 hypothetical protein BO80DRAFT_39489 [Aspergillus ibericus CBS 121593]
MSLLPLLFFLPPSPQSFLDLRPSLGHPGLLSTPIHEIDALILLNPGPPDKCCEPFTALCKSSASSTCPSSFGRLRPATSLVHEAPSNTAPRLAFQNSASGTAQTFPIGGLSTLH